jgi:DNA-binding transcriptional ArsR family regulator
MTDATTNAVEVIDEARRAQVLLHATRLELLRHLDEPASAATLARRLDLPRQRVNYHLRELEAQRLVERVEERRKGSCIERVYRRTGETFAISNAALGGLGTRPEAIRDRFSSAYQIALASRAVEELARQRAGAAAAGKKLPTFALEVDVRFGSAAARDAFGDELAEAVAALVAKHNDLAAKGGRTFRFYLGAYPRPPQRAPRG